MTTCRNCNRMIGEYTTVNPPYVKHWEHIEIAGLDCMNPEPKVKT